MASRPPRSVSPLPNSASASPCLPSASYSPETTGRSKRPPGRYEVGMFDDVKSSTDFAAALRVPLKAIPLIVFKDFLCKSPGCIHNAIEGNCDYCPAHSRRWYPLRHEKGGDLRGVDFTKFSSPGRGCDCNVIGCRAAGYFPGQDAMYIPAKGHDTLFATPGLFSAEQKERWRRRKEEKKKVHIYLYPWHFLPDHRRRKDDGAWELLVGKGSNQTRYYDLERNKYPFPPPRFSANRFIEDEFSTTHVRPQD